MDKTTLQRLLEGKASEQDLLPLIRRQAALTKAMALRLRDQFCHGEEVLRYLDPESPLWTSRYLFVEPERMVAELIRDAYVGTPEVILPLGFDQVRYGFSEAVDPNVPPDLAGLWAERETEAKAELAEQPTLDGGRICEKCQDLLIRILSMRIAQYRTIDGVWHGPEFVLGRLVPDGRRAYTEHLASLIGNWTSALDVQPRPDGLLTLPDLWIPDRPFVETDAHKAAVRISDELSLTGKSLRELHWRELEELVAELLHGLGFEITLTPRSADGGRDVVARGEFIPGEPALLAVEVKQMAVVPVGELREALWANRHFPALLLATSGRFSAGLIREARQEEARLRLVLKDGEALHQWLDAYAKERSLIS